MKVHHAPGGSSSICFGDDSSAVWQPPAPAPVATPVAVAAASPQHDDEFSKASNRTASRSTGGLQNVGNKIGSVPSVKLHHAPGGSSSICFGDDSTRFEPAAAAPVVPPVHIVKHEDFHSSESPFAQEGQGAVAASPISQRGGMQAPGGASTLSFEDDGKVDSAAPVGRAPGGDSTLSFGDDTGFTPRYIAPAPEMQPVVRATAAQHHTSESPFAVGNQTAVVAPTVRSSQAPGGSSTLSFGDDGQGFAQRYVAPAPVMAPVERATALQQHKSESPFDSSYVEEAKPEPTRTAGAGVAGSTCDNTIGDVPSVKLHAPPGGASSISFG